MNNLLERYNQPAPRYTSYPPIPRWREDVGYTELIRALETSKRPLSIYVHVPFCEQLCLYCGCNVLITRDRTLHRNFQGYTTHADSDLIAFGVSSISSVGDTFTQNYREIPAYGEAVAHGRPISRGFVRSDDHFPSLEGSSGATTI